jgi:polysaccharide pyruvyl transferase WcaK-like protein
MMDLLLELWVGAIIEWFKLQWILGIGDRWRPGRELKLLLAGYNGARNTGADARVEEMVRQIRHILRGAPVSLSVLTQNFELTRGYFQGARQVKLPDVFPPMLAREVPTYDGVIACEGSMFKSKFANALTTMMVGALGIAAARNRLSIGYGAEAGEMDPFLARLVRRYCRHSLIITRNEESRVILNRLGIPTELGTDTAWTFEPLGPEYGRAVLREAGWDERRPVLIVCPINPYWWPVKPSLWKYARHALTGAYRESHYRTIYFHRWGPDVVARYERYLTALARAIRAFRERSGVFPVLVAMEMLDRDACGRLSELLGGVPVFTSDRYDMYQLVSILRCGHLMVSSRYHGIVCSMPAGVVSAGVTMDERIRNLMHERGHAHLLLSVDDPDLEERLLEVLTTLQKEQEAIRDDIGRTVVRQLKLMARMGVHFEEYLHRCYPEFPIRRGILSWEEYLPPLSPTLRRLLEEYETGDSSTESTSSARPPA